jgi:hypothetical protein
MVLSAEIAESGVPRLTVYTMSNQVNKVKYCTPSHCITTKSLKLENQPQGQQWPKVFAGIAPDREGDCPTPLLQLMEGQILIITYFNKYDPAVHGPLPNIGDSVLLNNVVTTPAAPNKKTGIVNAIYVNCNTWEIVNKSTSPGNFEEALTTVLKCVAGNRSAALSVAQTFGCLSSIDRSTLDPGSLLTALSELDAAAIRTQVDLIKGLTAIKEKRLDEHDLSGTSEVLTKLITDAGAANPFHEKLVGRSSFGNEATLTHLGSLGSMTPPQIGALVDPNGTLFKELPSTYACLSAVAVKTTDWALNTVFNAYVVVGKGVVSQELCQGVTDGILHQASGLGSDVERQPTVGKRFSWEHLASQLNLKNKEVLAMLFEQYGTVVLNGITFTSLFQLQPAEQSEPAEMPNQLDKKSVFSLALTLKTIGVVVSKEMIETYFLGPNGGALIGRSGEEWPVPTRSFGDDRSAVMQTEVFNLSEWTKTTMKKQYEGRFKGKKLEFRLLSGSVVNLITDMINDPSNPATAASINDEEWCTTLIQKIAVNNAGDSTNTFDESIPDHVTKMQDFLGPDNKGVTLYCIVSN